MANTRTEAAAAMRELAKLLHALADDIDAGHARYVRGNFNFRNEPVDGLRDLGAAPLNGKLPHGKLVIAADVEFLTGQPASP